MTDTQVKVFVLLPALTPRCETGQRFWEAIDTALETLAQMKDESTEQQTLARGLVDEKLSAYFHHKSGEYEYRRGQAVKETTPPCFDCAQARRAVQP